VPPARRKAEARGTQKAAEALDERNRTAVSMLESCAPEMLLENGTEEAKSQ
jgi:hypothetical protein